MSLKDAQMDYERAMHIKPRAGLTDAPEVVAHTMRQGITGFAVKSVRLSSEGTDIGTGIDVSKDISQAAMALVDITKKELAKDLVSEFKYDETIKKVMSSLTEEDVSLLTRPEFAFEIEKNTNGYSLKLPSNESELRMFNKQLNNYLRRSDVLAISRNQTRHSFSRGTVRNIATRNRMSINRADRHKQLSELDRKIIKLSKRIQPAMQMSERQRFRMTRLAFSKMIRSAQQVDAGAGMNFTYNLIGSAASTIRMACMTASASKYALSWSMKKSRTFAVRASNTKLAQKMNASVSEHIAKKETLKKAKESLSSNIREHKVNKRVRDQKKRIAKNRRLKRFDTIKNAIRDPFGMRTKARTIFRRSKLGKVAGKAFRPIHVIKALTGKAVAFVMTVISSIITVFLLGFIAMILIILVAGLITSILTAIVSLFDFNSTDEEIREEIFKTIEACYEEQNNDIERLSQKYNNVTVSYVDIRDEEVYQSSEHQPLNEFSETTNSVELICMAQIYFDYDMKSAGKNRVAQYIRQLYNGSHLTTVSEHTYTVVDDEGNEVSYTDADITLTTYYFNSLFECQLSSKYGTLSGTEVSEQVWNYLRSAGFSEESAAAVMGNMYQESMMDPTKIGMNVAGGLCMWETLCGPANGSYNWGDLYQRAQAQGVPWTDLKLQLDFLMDSLPMQFRLYTGHGVHTYSTGALAWWPEAMTVENFKQLNDIALATEIFSRVFERPSIPRMEKRISYAQSYYSMYHGTLSE